MHILRLNHTNTTILIVTIVVSLLLALNYSSAQWTAAPSNPPNNNAAAPINTSGSSQVKSGPLGVEALYVNGGAQKIRSYSPTIEFEDTSSGQRDWWTHINNNNFYFIVDRNDNGNWSGESPWPLVLHGASGASGDYALFSNRIRANAYCDRGGGNCITPGTLVPTPPVCNGYRVLQWNGSSWSCIAVSALAPGIWVCASDGIGRIHSVTGNYQSGAAGCHGGGGGGG